MTRASRPRGQLYARHCKIIEGQDETVWMIARDEAIVGLLQRYYGDRGGITWAVARFVCGCDGQLILAACSCSSGSNLADMKLIMLSHFQARLRRAARGQRMEWHLPRVSVV